MGCIYPCGEDGVAGGPPSWAIVGSPVPSCTPVTCDATGNPPGCQEKIIIIPKDDGGGSFIWIIIGVIAVILIVGVGIGLFLYLSKSSKDVKIEGPNGSANWE